MWHRTLPIVLVAMFICAPLGAQEDGPAPTPEETLPLTAAQTEAGRLYELGLGQFDAKEFTTAAATFLEALALDPNSILAYNAAKAFENDGDLENARRYYEQALALRPDDALRTRIDDSLHRIEKSEERLREKLVAAGPTTGMVKFTCNKRATVVVDGQARGRTPLDLQLQPGTYTVELRKANHVPFVQTIEVTAGAEAAVGGTLAERSAAVAWTGLGLAGGGLVLGGIGALAAAGARQKFDEAQTLEAQRDPTLFAQLRSDGEGGKVAAQVLYGASILLVGTGATMLVVWALGREDEDVPAAASASVWVGPANVTVGLRW